jgi:hypothetical protein
MTHQLILLAVIWLGYGGAVGTVATAGGPGRLTGTVAAGGVFIALIASLLVFA